MAGKPKRPLWQLLVVGVVGVLLVCCALGVGVALFAPKQRPATAVAPTSVSGAAPAAGLQLGTVGQDVKVGDVRWKVLEVKDDGDTLRSDNQFVQSKKTAGKWLHLRVEVENQSSEPLTFTGVDLKDSKGRTFKTSSDGLMFTPQEEQCVIAQLSANVPKTCRLYYELPKDATGLHAVVGGLKLIGASDQEIDLGQ